MRDFKDAGEAMDGAGITRVAVGSQQGILKAVEVSEPVATILFDDYNELRIPLKYVQVLEAGD